MQPPRKFWIVLLPVLVMLLLIINCQPNRKQGEKNELVLQKDSSSLENEWQAPDTNSIVTGEEGALISYGRALVANTAYYLGPKGSVAHITNGMNCQNCHLDAGTRLYGNSFAAVASIYPTFRPRSGIIESIEFRVNDCFQRSLNGKKLDSTSREMRAIVAYIKWVGKDVPKGVRPKGANIEEIPFLARPADTAKGRTIYLTKCQTCHGKDGEGVFKPDSIAYLYPPLWGVHSYNTGAGLYRLVRIAGYIKNCMPFGTTHKKPQLTNEEAWDVGAFVVSQPRPSKDLSKDWPDVKLKAIDYPFGPYADTFPQSQHKYGPFGPIKKARDDANAKKSLSSK